MLLSLTFLVNTWFSKVSGAPSPPFNTCDNNSWVQVGSQGLGNNWGVTQIYKTQIWKWRQITLNILWQSLKSNKNCLTHFDSTLVSVFSRATNPTSPPRISRIRDPIHSSDVRKTKVNDKEEIVCRDLGELREDREPISVWKREITGIRCCLMHLCTQSPQRPAPRL
jgi:hypothetical protein